jgi:hypothetical protein
VNLLKINAANIINLDAVASISAGQDAGGFVFCVRYLVRGKEGEECGLASEKFTGDDAHALYKFFTDSSRCVELRDWMKTNSSPDIEA